MIIGITGKAGAGKDTAADVLVERFNFVKVSFSDPLKRVCKEIFDFSDEQLWGPSEKRNEPDKRYPRRFARTTGEDDSFNYDFAVEWLTPRYALQQLGTEYGRNCYGNIWVDHAMRTAKKLMTGAYVYHQRFGLQEVDVITPALRRKFELGFGKVLPAGGVVIPDVRFKNESDAIREAGGKIWCITRPGAGLEGDAGKHVSETAQDGIEADLTIRNGLDIKSFAMAVQHAFEQTFRDVLSGLSSEEEDPLAVIDKLEREIDFELKLNASITIEDGVQVLPNQLQSMDRLSTLLEQRQKDVDAGKIRPCPACDDQQDVAPFKRR